MCMCKNCEMFDREMGIQLMNVVKDLMREGEIFSRYSAFKKAREEFDWDVRYKDVQKEVRYWVETAVEEVGGYDSEFTENEDGFIYLEYFPIDESDDWDDKDDESDDWDDDEDESEDESNKDEDESDDWDDKYDDNEVIKEVETDSEGRLTITKKQLEKAGLDSYMTITANYFKDEDNDEDSYIILAAEELEDATKTKELTTPNDSVRFRIAKFFGDTYCTNSYYVECDSETNQITITLKS